MYSLDEEDDELEESLELLELERDDPELLREELLSDELEDATLCIIFLHSSVISL